MKLLLVTPYSPFGSAFGAQQRTKLLYDALGLIGQVDLLILEEKETNKVDVISLSPLKIHASWRRKTFDLRPFGSDPDLKRALQGVVDLSIYDVICGRYLRPMTKLDIPHDVRTIVDLDDLDYQHSSRNSTINDFASSIKMRVRKGLEKRAMRRFSAFWFVSDRDRQCHATLAGATLPNIPISTLPSVPEQAASHRILFVGALWYKPNRDGIEWFIDNSWAAIREAIPDATLRLVGAAPVADRRRWATVPGVEAVGFVENLAAEYLDTGICVAPIRSGGGTNIKILEALAHGRPCATTAFCRDALQPHFDDPATLAVAKNDRDLAEICIRMLLNIELRAAFARSGYKIVCENFNLAMFTRSVIKGVNNALVAPTPW